MDGWKAMSMQKLEGGAANLKIHLKTQWKKKNIQCNYASSDAGKFEDTVGKKLNKSNQNERRFSQAVEKSPTNTTNVTIDPLVKKF